MSKVIYDKSRLECLGANDDDENIVYYVMHIESADELEDMWYSLKYFAATCASFDYFYKAIHFFMSTNDLSYPINLVSKSSYFMADISFYTADAYKAFLIGAIGRIDKILEGKK